MAPFMAALLKVDEAEVVLAEWLAANGPSYGCLIE